MSPTHPRPPDGRAILARLQATLYRHRWIRWAAAGAAALIVFVSLRDPATEPAATLVEATAPGPAGLLPAGTRGVPIPATSRVFRTQDLVDVHTVIDGTAVVRGALIVDARDDEVVVAVPDSRVDATVDALATGGVMLVLVPHPPAAPR